MSALKTPGLSKLLANGLLWFGAAKDDPTQFASLQTLFTAPQSEPCFKSFSAEFGLSAIDSELAYAGLQSAALHELFYCGAGPSCAIPLLLAASVLKQEQQNNKFILWIGKNIWPSVFALKKACGAELLANCIFIDPPKRNLLWTIDTALRSHGAAVVIADCKEPGFVMTRRFALAAKKGNSIGILIRDSKKSMPSAAHSRWNIKPVPADSARPRFELELFKYRGRQPAIKSWIVELNDDETLSLSIPAGLAKQQPALDRSAQARAVGA